ncbi:relaxin receptor 2-like isoform X2 [Penaeus chinensis]|uniref:relaxin receptor 2-like isoform X2 n=1 Tax=Penaeus chinensis TaxID=139456 RepID=UPI001FB844A1|nr:relaxin receptor 2-like isoform X2 [Penaeus chinensis]
MAEKHGFSAASFLLSLALCSAPAACAMLSPVLGDGSCELGWFHCGENGTVCVEQRFVCDKKDDCPAGDDELGCVDEEGDSHLTKKILNRPVYPWEHRHNCSLTRYPAECTCRKLTRIHCVNKELTSVPQSIAEAVTALIFTNNSIDLLHGSFSIYPDVRLLHLDNNGIGHIPDGAFLGLALLSDLSLANNSLSELRPGALAGLSSLSNLDVSCNQLRHFDDILAHLPKLLNLWFNFNLVTLQKRKVHHERYRLQELFLENNQVDVLSEDSLLGLAELTSLYLRHNRIREIRAGAFRDQTLLVDLELNYNKIRHLDAESFKGLDSLKILHLEGNPLVVVPATTLQLLPNLASLYMRNIELNMDLLLNISQDLTYGINTPNISHVYFERFRYCSYLPHVPDCRPKTDGVSSFEHLLVRVELRVAVWLVALMTLVGNMTVLGGRAFTRDDNKILSLFIRNLAVADLLTGVYLFVVAVKDAQFRSEYHEYAYYWMTSWHCTITGVLSMTSSEVSVLILTFMSVERWLCITWPLGAPKLSLGTAKVVLVAIWSVGLLLALVPVFWYTSKQGFYGTNGLCFPLHLDDPWVPGWVYSAFIFVGINQIGVVMILMSYTGMFYSIRITRANTPLSLGDREFALRFFFIVFTDCVCWTPIIILRILALAGCSIQPDLYAYVVVVLLPINSALNPFLYTFTTSKFRSRARRFLSSQGICHWRHRRDSDSEVTRTSFFRSATYKWTNGRDVVQVYNGTHALEETTLADLSKGVVVAREESIKAETKE